MSETSQSEHIATHKVGSETKEEARDVVDRVIDAYKCAKGGANNTCDDHDFLPAGVEQTIRTSLRWLQQFGAEANVPENFVRLVALYFRNSTLKPSPGQWSEWHVTCALSTFKLMDMDSLRSIVTSIVMRLNNKEVPSLDAVQMEAVMRRFTWFAASFFEYQRTQKSGIDQLCNLPPRLFLLRHFLAMESLTKEAAKLQWIVPTTSIKKMSNTNESGETATNKKETRRDALVQQYEAEEAAFQKHCEHMNSSAPSLYSSLSSRMASYVANSCGYGEWSN